MDWFAMGGYAAYIWPSYGFTALVLVALLISAWRTMRVLESEVERLRGIGDDPRRRDGTSKDAA